MEPEMPNDNDRKDYQSVPPDPVMSLMDIDPLLSDEERQICDVVRGLVDRRVRPHIAEWYLNGISPGELAPELGSLGLLGMYLQGYGCSGTNAVSYGPGLHGARSR
jgi:glutaryl-CoA dehydrogenase